MRYSMFADMAVMVASWRAKVAQYPHTGVLESHPCLGARYAGVFVKALFGRTVEC
jgi:hypothetical protein